MFHYTLFEIVGHFQYGEELGVLRAGARKSWVHGQPRLIKASNLLSALADFTWINLLLRWTIPWMSKWFRKAYFKPSNDLIDHRLQIQSDEPDLIGLTFRNSRSSALTEKDIRANAHIMMIGGAETTMGLMTFLTACLLQHPECFARLKDEIRTEFHHKSQVSLESVSKLAYLDACIKEALRMYPPLPGAMHRVTPPGGAPIAGHWVAGNTRVYIPIFAATHSPNHFWNPESFVPDRWLEGAEGPYQKDNKAACHPFSAGPRGCIGQESSFMGNMGCAATHDAVKTKHNEYMETYTETHLQNLVGASQGHLNSNEMRQKWTLTCLAAFTTFLAMINGTIITVAHFEISKHFHDFGTGHIFLSTYLLFLCFLVPQAVAQNFATLVVTRFFAGGCVAILANTAAGVVGNLWSTEWFRSIPVSLYILGCMSWSSTGPVMGAMIFHSLGWRWISHMQLICFGALFPNGGESSGHEASGAVLSRLNLQGLVVSTTRPMILFTIESVLFASTIWSAFTVGTLFHFTQSIEQVFMGLYNWEVSQTGYVQCAIIIGECLGWLLYFAFVSRNTEVPGTPFPEARLYMAVEGGVFGLSGSMFVYAWTSYSSAGSVCVVTGVTDYVVDFYCLFSGSAMGAVAAGENVFSAFLPLATMSIGRVCYLVLFCLVLSLIPTMMFVLGKEVRARSAFMNEMTYDATKKRSETV
ncbi:cytochrome P450 [Aspergillus eucalypticola CBS 122712]|uniref:Cytochrome P450 n=1 Tax=Aspergillus eucalypticola (strain CBS 122712 / IBT 29274) TaxID=1448314 RepID=A0A317UJZ6_ASPEC|nr:cytochrome P450 [Aspergillus eucalypticola CBS 122712]PWY62021.1 cytochrome P450 [Aspergillus eucalypticola CBS 122712]